MRRMWDPQIDETAGISRLNIFFEGMSSQDELKNKNAAYIMLRNSYWE